MSKELEALKRMEYFVNEEMGIKTFKQSGWHIEGTDDYEMVKEALQRLESIDNANPSEITLRELVSKHILNPNSVVDVFEQDRNEPHYSNRIFMGMAWEMEKHEIGNRKLKYIFSAVAETISESDRVCIEVK